MEDSSLELRLFRAVMHAMVACGIRKRAMRTQYNKRFRPAGCLVSYRWGRTKQVLAAVAAAAAKSQASKQISSSRYVTPWRDSQNFRHLRM
eukprot:5779970-Pleurochrysis_carterae.AAC.1